MHLSIEQRAALLHPRAAADYRDPLGASTVIAAEAVGLALVTHLDALGYRQTEGPDGEVITYRVAGPGRSASRVPWRSLVEEIRLTALALLDDLADGTTPGARRAANTAAALRAAERGHITYLRRATSFARECVQDADDALVADAETTRRAALPSQAPTTARPRSHRRADARTTDLAQCRDLLTRWVPTLPPGRHKRADVWSAFQAARNASRQRLVNEGRGAVLRLGERQFFALLAEIGYPVETGHARSRWVRIIARIADEVHHEIRDRFRAGDRVGALLAQRDAYRLARSGSAPVVDLDAVRDARGRAEVLSHDPTQRPFHAEPEHPRGSRSRAAATRDAEG